MNAPLRNTWMAPKYENPDEASVEVKVELVENDSMAIDEFEDKNETSDIVQNMVKSRTLRFYSYFFTYQREEIAYVDDLHFFVLFQSWFLFLYIFG